MSSTTSNSYSIEPASHRPAWRRHLVRGLAFVLAVALFAFGLMAIEAGVSNYRSAADPSVAAAREAARQAIERGESVEAKGLGEGVRYQMLTMVAKLNSERYAYGENGLIETLVHYATMPTLNAKVLSLHNVLGGFCMLFGALQFWPALRRQYPRWHRGFGMSYVVGGQVAMIAAVTYLLLTPVDKIYDQMTFWVLLWALAIGVSVSLWLSMGHLRRGEIAQHQGYMCLNYGLLLTAPVLRMAWVGMGWLDPAARQIEGAFAAHAVLVPLSLLCGYGLFVVNRWTQPDKPLPKHASEQGAGRWLALGVAGVLPLSAYALVRHMLLSPGLQVLDQASVLMPVGLLQMDQRIVVDQAALRVVFTLASVAGLLLGAWLLWRSASGARTAPLFGHRSALALSGTAAVAGLVGVIWGVQMGLPSFETLTGGTLFFFGGLVTLLFAGLLAWATVRGLQSWADEWGLFVLTCLVATPSFYAWLPWVASFEPAALFVQGGHVYRTAGMAQWYLLVLPFLYAIYGNATRAKRAR